MKLAMSLLKSAVSIGLLIFALILSLLAIFLMYNETGEQDQDKAKAAPLFGKAADDPTVMIIGDSTSSLYNDTTGSTAQGWWSMVADAKGWQPIKNAEYGSGFLRHGFGTYNNSGKACTGTILKDPSRLDRVVEEKPDYILVAAGRNDLKKCVDGKLVEATTSNSVAAARRYFIALGNAAQEAGIPKSKIFVLTPWGALDEEESTVLRPKIRDSAREFGFKWITTYLLAESQTTDGYHQNASGNRAYRNDVLEGLQGVG